MNFYKTDGSCTVTTRGTDVELIFFHAPMTFTLTPDRVRFLARALTELSEEMDTEKEVTA